MIGRKGGRERIERVTLIVRGRSKEDRGLKWKKVGVREKQRKGEMKRE